MKLPNPSLSGTASVRRPLAACTIIARNYLSHATVLAKSYLQHEPGARFYLLVVDRLPEGFEVDADVRLIDPDELALPHFHELCFKYNVVELSTAVKPSLLSLLINRYQEEEIVYLDPDILITAPLNELREALRSGSIVLTPHILKPIPMDDRKPSEQNFLTFGAYNLGFIALKKSNQARELLRWWEERLRDGCRIDVPHGLFVDQKWADLIPSLFSSTVLLRDETYNVAFWNLHERIVERRGEQFLINGHPMTFFHFSGFNPERRLVLSRHQNRTEVTEGTALAELLHTYADLHMRNGYPISSKWQYGYSGFDNGIRINALLRQLYLSLDRQARMKFGNPFQANGTDSFLDWATKPSSGEANLSMFLESVYRAQYDVAARFPDVNEKDREAFVKWARTVGSREMGYEPELVRVGEDPPAARNGNDGAVALSEDVSSGDMSQLEVDRVVPKHIRYHQLIRRIREVVRAALPWDATVIVVSKGDPELLKLDGRRALHFPQTEDGVYAGYIPADSAEAITHLEALRVRGGDFLLIPSTALWWLEHYQEFKQHLERHYRAVVRCEDTCLIFALRPSETNNHEPPV